MHMNTQTYAQLRYSRSDGRSWSTGVSGYGAAAVVEAREMATSLAKSAATDYIEVIIETRDGAVTESSKVCKWSRAHGWTA